MTFDRDTAVEEYLRQQARIFNHLPDVGQQGLSAALPPDVLLNSSSGFVPTILVAASDASQDTIDSTPAAYRCDGTADNVEIQAAIDAIEAMGTGRVVSSEGTFNLAANLQVAGNVHFLGLGSKWVFANDIGIRFNDGAYVSRWEGIEFNRPVGQSTGLFDGRGGVSAQPMVIITGCWFDDIEADFVIGNKGISTYNRWIVTGNYFTNIVLHNGGGFNKSGILVMDEGGSRDGYGVFSNNYIDGVTKIDETGDSHYIAHVQSGSSFVATGNYIINATTLTGYFDGDIHASHNVIEKVATPGDHDLVSAPGIDSTAIHDDTAGEIDAIVEATPVSGDWVLFEDTSDGDAKKKADAVAFLGGGASPLTTKGDVFGYDTDDARIPVGANDQVLTADSTQSLGVKWAETSGGAGGSTPSYMSGFGEDNLAASLTNSQLYRNVQGIQFQTPIVTSHSGDIVGLTVASSEARTAGTATFEIYKNGTGIGLTVVLDATNPQYVAASQAAALDTFVSGDRLDVRVTTDGSWAPTTADVEASIVIADGVTLSTVPEWVSYLAERQSDETANGDDDFFADGTKTGWTESVVTGSATWTESRGVMSLKALSGATGDAATSLKSILASGPPYTIESCVRLFDVNTDFHSMGICFADGTGSGANVVEARLASRANGTDQLQAYTGTLTNTDATSRVLTTLNGRASGLLYMRLVNTAANTWAVNFSQDGVSWSDLGLAPFTFTMTPTHYGMFATNFAGTTPLMASWEYFRVDEADLDV